MLSCEIWEILKNSFLKEHLRETASVRLLKEASLLCALKVYGRYKYSLICSVLLNHFLDSLPTKTQKYEYLSYKPSIAAPLNQSHVKILFQTSPYGRLQQYKRY